MCDRLGLSLLISIPGGRRASVHGRLREFQFGSGREATDLRFLRVFDDAGDGRFVRTGDR